MRKAVAGLLCAMTFCIPWEETAVIPGVQTVLFSLGFLTLALALLTAVMRRRVRPVPKVFLAAALFVAWSFVSLTWALDGDAALRKCTTFLSLLMFVWLIWEYCDSEERVLGLFRAYVLGSGVSLIGMFAAYAGGGGAFARGPVRYTGGGLNQNDIAIILDIAIPMAAYLASRSSPRGAAPRRLYLAFIPAAIFGVVLTGSRDGLITLVLGLVLTLFAMGREGVKAAAALLLAASAAVFAIPDGLARSVFLRVAEGGEAHTFQQRLLYWRAGLDYWRDHPWRGCGAGNFVAAITPALYNPNVAHNTFISLLVEGGAAGFFLMTAVWLLLLRMVLTMGRRERLLWLTVGAVWSVGSMALSWEYAKSTWLVYACAMAHAAAPRPLPRPAEAA